MAIEQRTGVTKTINISLLQTEINADPTISGQPAVCQSIFFDGATTYDFTFDVALTGGSPAALDAVIAAHNDLGQESQPHNHNTSTVDPTVTNDESEGYSIGSHWYNTVTQEAFILLDTTAGAAVWVSTTDVDEATVDHDALLNYVANEHLDWTADQGGSNINDANIPASAVTQHTGAIDHDTLLNYVANEHLDWTADQGANDINDANIAASSVTQHTGSIDHDTLLNFDADEHIDWTADQGATNIESENLVPFVGDTGTGGDQGAVPAPAAGDAADNNFLHADGTWQKAPFLPMKAGQVPSGSFTGNPKKATVALATAFPDANYSVILTLESTNNSTWSPGVESVTASGFTINMHSSSVSMLTRVYWVAIKHGESS